MPYLPSYTYLGTLHVPRREERQLHSPIQKQPDFIYYTILYSYKPFRFVVLPDLQTYNKVV